MPEIVKRVSYRWGMTESADATDSLNRVVWTAPHVPKEVLGSLEREHVLEHEGDSGDPDWGEPIEVDWVEIGLGSRTQTIRMFNRGILLFHTDSEDVRRLHRFFNTMQDLAKDTGKQRRRRSR